MNFEPKQSDFKYAGERTDLTRQAIDVEQAVIAYGLAEPARYMPMISQISIDDVTEPLHQQIISLMQSLHDDKRNPSVELVADAIGNKTEIEPGLTVRQYLRNIVNSGFDGAWVSSIESLIDALADNSSKIALQRAANQLQACLGGSSYRTTRETAQEAAMAIDEVLAKLRTGKLRTYDAEGAAEIALAHMRGESPDWPTTGLTALDNLIGGWPRGQMTIIAGRPGMGKSAIATSAVLRGAMAGHPTAFFSLEMVGEQLGSRLLTDLAFRHDRPIYYQDIMRKRIEMDIDVRRLEDARNRLKDLPLMIHEQRGMTLTDIYVNARKFANEFDRSGQRLETIVVDHMLLVNPPPNCKSRYDEVRKISKALSELGDELDVSMVALCQLSRGVEGRDNRRPTMSDLRDSGTIEEDASLIIFPFRPEYYLRNKEDNPDKEAKRQDALEKVKGLIEFGVDKNRNGETGTIEAFCSIGANVIRDLSYRSGAA